MPTYEYACLDCKKKFEIVEPISRHNPKNVKCPKCGKKNVDRQWSSLFVETAKKS
jgi:putative FmdB family regulatory protein